MNLNKSQKSLLLVLGLTILFSVVEFYVHQKSGSLILFNHLMHCIYDAVGILIALFGASFIGVKGSNSQSFGYYRYVILAALFNGMFLLLMNARALFSGIVALVAESHIHDHEHLLSISVLGLVINFLSFLILHNTSKNLNNKVVLLHIIRDLLNSFIAIFVAVIGRYYDIDLLDSIGSIAISLLVIFGTLSIIKKCIHILCNGSPKYISGKTIEAEIKGNFSFVSDVHHVHIWYLTEDKFIASMHIILGSHKDDAIEQINSFLLEKYNIIHNTVQIENICVQDNSSCVKV